MHQRLSRLSVPARDHQSRRLALPPLLPEFPGCGGPARPTRHHSDLRDDSALVSDVRTRLRAAAAARTGAPGRHLVSGRIIREHSGSPSVSLAGRGRGRRRPRHPRAVAAQSRGGRALLSQVVEGTGLRTSPPDHGHAPQLRSGAPHRHAVRGAQHAAIREQPRRGLASTDAAAGTPAAPVQVGQTRATLLVGAWSRAEPLSGGAPPAPSGSPPLTANTIVLRLGCGDVCRLNDDGNRVIEGPVRPLLVNLTVPTRLCARPDRQLLAPDLGVAGRRHVRRPAPAWPCCSKPADVRRLQRPPRWCWRIGASRT